MKRDVIGQKIGRLTCLRYTEDSRNHAIWRCDCGTEKRVYIYSVLNGDTSSCGCYNIECVKTRKYKPRHDDFTGKVFGELTVLSRGGRDSSRNARWMCRCSCGAEKEVSAHALRRGLTVSCGHVQKEKARLLMTKHGQYKEKSYIASLSQKRAALKRGAQIEFVNPALVYERDLGLCQLCGMPVGAGEFHLDHKVAIINGGHHSYENCQTSCSICNLRKGRKDIADCAHLWLRGGDAPWL